MKTNETDTTTATAVQSTKSTVLLSIDKIRPNPNNPRRSYDENALAELAASIATHGLIQPIRVRAAEQGGYIIVCGERRYRAVQLLGQTEIEQRRCRSRRRTGDLRPRAFGEHSARGDAVARRGRSLQSRHADPRRGRRRRGRTLRQERAVYLLPDETQRTDPRCKKTPARKLYYIGSRYGVGTIRERPAKDDLQRPPQRRGGVAEILRKGVQADGRRPLYERSGPVPLRPNGVRQMQAQHQSIRYVRHGKRTVYEPGMSRSQKPRIHRAKKRRTARAKPEIHPLQRPLRMRRP